eukprot:CAMPEP_0172036194 /NCGR_PEP_ID=MMETSP1041-20130122/22028_1 /TAXON_ID=464988 /ORGANISM="Hemiselmis andersenii, Strain CCMP439" /LENGTH=58 /DNA_ID=CAMNT_0012693395 /DNA_START=297 /DNA_END=470 /DNA_ORIENTATION=-
MQFVHPLDETGYRVAQRPVEVKIPVRDGDKAPLHALERREVLARQAVHGHLEGAGQPD